MKFSVAIVAGLTLSGCVSIDIKGQMNDGRPFSADMDISGSAIGVTLTNAAGMRCTGETPNDHGYRYDIPVQCVDGRSGMVVATVSQDETRMDGTVTLSNGASGVFILDSSS